MPLKNDFNAELKKLNKRPNELDCLNALIKTLKNGNYPNVKTEKAHQKYVSFHVKNNKLKREICDIIVVFRFKNYLRVSFVQNKIVNSKYQGLGKFKINAGQHCFLVTKPYFNFGNRTLSILHNSSFNTITAYSVFYKTNNGDYDFDFSSADFCLCYQNNTFKCCTFNEKCLANHKYKTLNKSNIFGINNFDSLINANEIEQNPFFGEVIGLNNPKLNELIYIIKTLSNSEMLNFLHLENVNSTYISQETDSDYAYTFRYIIAIDMTKKHQFE